MLVGMFTRVVVGWDGTPESEAAATWAADRRDDAPLTLLHAIGTKAGSSPHLRATGEGSSDRAGVVEAAERLRSTHPDLDIAAETTHGSAIDALGDLLGRDTLVVVGGPSRRPTSRWTVGSHLAGRHGGGTVAVIPPARPAERRSVVAAGIDGSDAALAAVEVAAAEADRLAEPLELVHAWQVPASWNAMLSRFASDVAVLRTVHEGLLDDAVAFARRLGADAVGRLEAGSPTDVLHRIGRTCELLVVASHGARGMTRFMLGSVSHELLFDPPAPMMVTAPRP